MDNLFIEEKREIPQWLKKIIRPNIYGNSKGLRQITENMLSTKTNIILENSCFYYCAGSDITPIIALEGYIHSFIYSENGFDQNFNGCLLKLKDRLQKKGFNEIQKMNIDQQCLNLHKSDFLITYSETFRGLPTGEFSIWENGSNIFSLIYLCWDDIYVWNCLYKKYQVYPIVICNSNPEGSHMFADRWNWNKNNMPKYVIGHENHLGNNFIKIGEVDYYGDYANNSTVYKRV
jgi:hypothetical protein